MLVGGFKYEFYCRFHIWDVILPIDFIFFRGVETTNQYGISRISWEDIMGYLWGVLKWNISWDLWDLCDHGENEKWSNDLDGLGVSTF